MIDTIDLVGATWFSTHHASAADAVAGIERESTAPTYPLLVARARRFTSLVTQMHVEVCGILHPQSSEPPAAVFATTHGEIQTAEKLIADFRDTATVSSARFALSVHNSASGVYSVATGSTAPTTTITGANAIAAAWVEAVTTVLDTGRPVLLSIADEPVPAVFECPSLPYGYAAGFLLAPCAGGRRAQLAITHGGQAADPVRALARAVDAWTTGAAATVELGLAGPAMSVALSVPARDER